MRLPTCDGEDLIHRGADANHLRVEAHRFAGQHVHPPEVRAGGGHRALVVEALDEEHVLAMRHHRQQPGTDLHVGPAALRPPVNRLDAIREEDDPEAQRRRVRLRGGRSLADQRQRFHPGQRQRDAHAPQEVTTRRMAEGVIEAHRTPAAELLRDRGSAIRDRVLDSAPDLPPDPPDPPFAVAAPGSSSPLRLLN